MTRVNRTKAEDDPALGQRELDRVLGTPGGIRCGSMTVDGNEERTERSRKEDGSDNGFPH